MNDRNHIPVNIVRAVLVEAGHRCAISTCRATTTEIAHITPWSQTQDDSFENLIALCPNCHTRYDQKKEIDQKSVQMYKHNLSILNNRYGEIERRVFQWIGTTGERVFVLGFAGDLMVANAVKDGFFEDKKVEGMAFAITSSSGFEKSFPASFTFWVTDLGMDFIRKYIEGIDIA